MKIKHFQGYGSVTATKLSNRKINDTTKRLIIKVSGNHEWGLYRNDRYDVYNWLVKRFAKDCPSYRNIVQMIVHSDYERINDRDVEVCIYSIDYTIE